MSTQIMIDPGHGGLDNGASYGYMDEDDINLAIGYYLDYELSLAEISHTMTRNKDAHASLAERVHKANIKAPELFVSIHCDAFHKHTASGMSIHIYKYPSLGAINAANEFERQLLIHFPGHRYRGIKRSNFQVLRETHMPAVLIECEFLSNSETRKFLKEPENQRRLARSIKIGCYNYLAL